MSVWVFKSPFSVHEENDLAGRQELPLPYDGVTDLTGIDSEIAMRQLFASLHPAAAPETINRQADIYWGRFSQLMIGDMVVIPLHAHKAALAEVLVPYRYRVDDGRDVHYAEVRFLKTDIAHRKLKALGKLMTPAFPMQMVDDKDGRKAVFSLVEGPHNRFAKLQWMATGFVILAELLYVIRTFGH